MRFRVFTIFLALLCSLTILIGQQVSTIPAFPSEDRSVTIQFDATGSALQNISGDVYAHTGVIINASDISSGNWRYVIAPWPSNPNDNLPKARLTRMGNNQWELHIANIRTYYGIPASVSKIYQLAFVFRNAAGTQQTGNIYIDIYDEPINIRFDSPQVSPVNPLLVNIGTSLPIRVVGNAINGTLDSITLFANESRVAAVSGRDTLDFTYDVVEQGRTTFRAIAHSEMEEISSEFFIMVNPSLVEAPIPENIQDGINYDSTDPTKVTLSLFAPHKSFVYVIGDFNNWEVNEAYFMNRDFIRTDSVRYWITIEGLEPGKEYAYQYLVDGQIRIADPYTEKVLDPWNDQEIINKGVYPGLIPYPVGKTENMVSVLQTGQIPYVWKINDFQAPPVEELVVYELLVRDFIGDHSYKTLADTLDYLQRLGVNAIELMPINEFEGNLSWGYNPAFFFAPDKYYGPKNELKRFIDEAHSRGMAVILDMVWNHSFGLSPLLRMYFDGNNNRPSDDNPWYHDQIFVNPAMQFGYKFNHGSPVFQEFMKRANLFWINEYKIDGYRFDLTKGFTTRMKGNNDPWGSVYDQERVNNINRVANEIWAVNPNAYVICEHLADNSEEIVLANAGMLLWGNMNHQYNEATMGFPSDLRWGVYRERNWNHPNLITYMESHDEERLVVRNRQFGNSSGNYNTRNLSTALKRVGLASAFFYTLPGPKMLWQFGELGYDFSINYCPNGTINNGCRVDPKPIRWDYYLDEDRRALYNVTADLIYLKRNFATFNTRDFDYELQAPFKRIRLRGEDLKVVAVGNFRVVSGNIRANFYETGTWYDYISGDSLIVTDTAMLINLAPGEYRVYLDRKVDRPSGDITTSTAPEIALRPTDVTLFPNPSYYRSFMIRLSQPEKCTITVFNLSGQAIHFLKVDQEADQFHVQLPSDLSTGVYLVQITTTSGSYTTKWVLH